MRKVVLAALMVLVPAVGMAYEIEKNPDRRMSFGINFDRFDMGGDYENDTPKIKIADAGTWKQNIIKADVRVPVTSFMTLSLGGGYVMTDAGWAIVTKDERWKMKGYNINAGVRFYIP